MPINAHRAADVADAGPDVRGFSNTAVVAVVIGANQWLCGSGRPGRSPPSASPVERKIQERHSIVRRGASERAFLQTGAKLCGLTDHGGSYEAVPHRDL